MTGLGVEKTPLFLARFALLAIVELGDPVRAVRLVEAAAAMEGGPETNF
jgi:hypothetical protein